MGLKELFRIDGRYHGGGKLLFAWHPEGSYVATTAEKKVDRPEVHIFDRYGKHVSSQALQGPCSGLEWDREGEKLAVLQGGQHGIVQLWDSNTKKWSALETGMKDISFLKWSKVGAQLAIGTRKGNLLIYNKKTHANIPVIGKHTKAITCGSWSSDNILVLGSEDKTLTLNDSEGTTIDLTDLRMPPADIQISNQKSDNRKGGLGQQISDQTISMSVGKKTLLLYNRQDKGNPVELQFQPQYGDIVSYHWYGDGYIMIGFANGYLVVISTHMKEIGEELYSNRFYKEAGLRMVCFNDVIQKAATCGEGKVAIVDMTSNFKEITSDSIDFSGLTTPDKIEFTRDGQILSVSTDDGTLIAYLASVPVLHDATDTKLVYPTALRELSIVDVVQDHTVAAVTVAVEPSLIALGPDHVAVAVNTRAWFYSIDTGTLVCDKEYLGTVDEIKLNRNYAAVRSEGRVYLHVIPHAGGDGSADGQDAKVFPEKEEDHDITALGLTYDFLIYGTARGTIAYFLLHDWTLVNEYRLESGVAVRRLYPNHLGTRVLCITDNHQAVVYNPIDDQVVPVPKFSSGTRSVMWDSFDTAVFVTADQRQFTTYVYAQDTVDRSLVNIAGITPRDRDISPIICYNGQVTVQTQSGALARVVLSTHDALLSQLKPSLVGSHPDRLNRAFQQNLALFRLKDAWELACAANTAGHWTNLAEVALQNLELDLATRAYRKLGNAGMVMSLERIHNMENKNMLAGYIAMFARQYDKAEQFFLRVKPPQVGGAAALRMRCDLLQWEQALKLAETLAPQQVPEIARQYAQQLEFNGEYAAALELYLKGQDEASRAGVARMTLRLGDIPRGMKLAVESGSRQLCRECAAILESLKQFQDAAALYQKGEMYEKAVAIYIQAKDFHLAAPLMAKITAPKLHLQYAKAKEAEGAYMEAAKEYAAGKDMDSVVRLNLAEDKLNNPQKAFSIVRQARSTEGARLVAEFCKEHKDYRGAIEFLLMAKQVDQAFQIAKDHDEMDAYAEALGDNGTKEDYLAIAAYYEQKGKEGKAGEFLARCGEYFKALKLFLQCGENELDKAIAVVGKANSELLTQTLIDFLMGETDGEAKDPQYIFRLYMALGNFPQAAKTAIIIAKQDQTLGNYKIAHQTLFQTYRDLIQHRIKIPQELTRNLLILHSYVIVKNFVNEGDHVNAAYMLIRVAKNISKFPAHIVNILTSTVVECQRAKLYQTAFEYASMLMRPEYRKNIKPDLKPKIEAIVRKRQKQENEVTEPLTPCPYCKQPLPETDLDCRSCKNSLPYCIATGKHMVFQDWSNCPSCSFPALYTALARFRQCPMCEAPIAPSQIRKIDDPSSQLTEALQRGEEESAGGGTSTQAAAAATAGGGGASIADRIPMPARQESGGIDTGDSSL
eukprot:TRINITY_DN1387_c0_g1::TRINITY_DN1387_c0_g1_i1::g.20098::m.20098 TRINITY_DN1387_c0_g1::TRINITY_DN1387_c0_g1_i1::g.20098  ORF type:complete len:1400 (-),score=364.31,sp/Q3UGF1/WDR19_MOUSE/44.20/0.0,IKI3/PF04762.7/0.00012,IKI3/PF04762.7/2.2,WD40/PF00400.27/1e+02,WD40/PF00400.27/1e+03,WD40/PF00400.27/0.025,WD40/PF00400.27/2.4e+03,eIF2A/PF08662.6/0.00032,Clathrin/PF00637.15/1.4e+03,Clathrin/PF00637.15/8.4e+02,Clathrin/PF00637.15/0.11,Clathrin/PF00637.15/0.91,Clathrin/PF00637.15/51,Clathrin/PF00637.15